MQINQKFLDKAAQIQILSSELMNKFLEQLIDIALWYMKMVWAGKEWTLGE